jgi:hypothetical protein
MTIPRNLSFLAEGASSTGVLATANGGTNLTSFTVNGIPYASSSSVLTTNSSLTFNGTGIGIGVSSASYGIDIQGTASNIAGRIRNLTNGSASTSTFYFENINNYSGYGQAYIQSIGSGTSGKTQLAFGVTTTDAGTSASEVMRINSSGGVSIGNTTDPGSKNLSVSGTINTQGYTVAGLPTGVTGARAYVTNALAPTYGATVVGGGTVTIPVFYNGTNWICA